jgi:hypothetical protein
MLVEVDLTLSGFMGSLFIELIHFCHKMVNSMSMPSCIYMTMLTMHIIAVRQMPGTPT